VHHIVCQHQIEVEVWPALAELSFRDERYVNPLNTQVQFNAVVYNGPTNRVTWQVADGAGGPGLGTIDENGLYVAPLKGTAAHAVTEIVIATSVDDPMRKAFARVAVVGLGPEPLPEPKVEIYPKRSHVYYRKNYSSGDHNEYIDMSNTRQLFRASVYHTESQDLQWLKDGSVVKSGSEAWYLYEPSNDSGAPDEVKITVRLAVDHDVKDEATVLLINYSWPGIVD
jgi:hypothetical protein